MDNPEIDWVEDFGYENGQYQNECSLCHKMFVGHKRRFLCKKCYVWAVTLVKPDSETLLG